MIVGPGPEQKPVPWRDYLAAAGLACLVAAAFLVHPVLGLAAVGAALILVSFLIAYLGGDHDGGG